MATTAATTTLQSFLARKIAAQLPPAHHIAWGRKVPVDNPDERFFADEDERARFIFAVSTIITKNGSQDLSGCEFQLLYYRSGTTNVAAAAEEEHDAQTGGGWVASIVAVDERGAIVAKIETPGARGTATQRDAFAALQREVSRRFEELMRPIPNLVGSRDDGRDGGGSARAGTGPASTANGAPPPYDFVSEKA